MQNGDHNAYLVQLVLGLSETTYIKVQAPGRYSTLPSFVLYVKNSKLGEGIFIYSPIISSLYPELFKFKWKDMVRKVTAIFLCVLGFG